jgi:hypothetical protein
MASIYTALIPVFMYYNITLDSVLSSLEKEPGQGTKHNWNFGRGYKWSWMRIYRTGALLADEWEAETHVTRLMLSFWLLLCYTDALHTVQIVTCSSNVWIAACRGCGSKPPNLHRDSGTFKTRLRHRLSWLKFSRVSSCHMLGQYVDIRDSGYLPHTCQFTIHLHLAALSLTCGLHYYNQIRHWIPNSAVKRNINK